MIKIIILILVLSVGFVRWFNRKQKQGSANYLLISMFLQTIPLGYGKAIHTYLEGQKVDSEFNVRLGAFDNNVRIEISLAFFCLFIFLGFTKYFKNAFIPKYNIWLYILIVLCIISYFNPTNIFPLSFFPAISILVQLVLLLKLIEYNFNKADILKGIYDGLLLTTLLQFVLAIGYPVLGIDAVVTVFHGEGGLEWAQRRDTMSAVGTFGHPGTLSLYSLICSIFFIGCYLKEYKKRISFYFIALNICIIVLTFSRTTYICTALIILVLVTIEKQGRGIFSLKNILIFVGSFSVVLFVIYLSPLSKLYFESDADSQIENRFGHWLLGYEMFKNSPIFGVGINSHVYFMLNKLSIAIDPTVLAFLIRSPIHNIHIIILAETGLIGFLPWIYFLFSRLKSYSKQCSTKFIDVNIYNITYVGILLSVIIYGFFGWSPFRPEVLILTVFLGYFAKILPKGIDRSLNLANINR